MNFATWRSNAYRDVAGLTDALRWVAALFRARDVARLAAACRRRADRALTRLFALRNDA